MDTSIFTRKNRFLMLALDHRESFRRLLNSQNPKDVSAEGLINLKRKIIEPLVGQFSGILIDTEHGLPAYKELKAAAPYLLCIEKSGYEGGSTERYTKLQYSVLELKEMGANGVKLLLYFNPFSKSAANQVATGKKVCRQVQESDLPLFLEVVTYKTSPAQNRSELVFDSLKMLIASGVKPDVWKLEYPGDAPSCKGITALVGETPWILLTRGVSFEQFKQQLTEATPAGAVGFLAGRALWQEVLRYSGQKQQEFLQKILPHRFEELSKIVFGGGCG